MPARRICRITVCIYKRNIIKRIIIAGVAKLADASALGADASNGMQVRFLSPAPLRKSQRVLVRLDFLGG
jgi:hypothetical protein